MVASSTLPARRARSLSAGDSSAAAAGVSDRLRVLFDVKNGVENRVEFVGVQEASRASNLALTSSGLKVLRLALPTSASKGGIRRKHRRGRAQCRKEGFAQLAHFHGGFLVKKNGFASATTTSDRRGQLQRQVIALYLRHASVVGLPFKFAGLHDGYITIGAG